jgi:hypothetical protein
MPELLLVARSGEGLVNGGQPARRGRDGGAARTDAAATSNSPGIQRWMARRKGRDAVSNERRITRHQGYTGGRNGCEQARRPDTGLRWGGGHTSSTDGNGVLAPNAKITVFLILVPRIDTFSHLETVFLFFSPFSLVCLPYHQIDHVAVLLMLRKLYM